MCISSSLVYDVALRGPAAWLRWWVSEFRNLKVQNPKFIRKFANLDLHDEAMFVQNRTLSENSICAATSDWRDSPKRRNFDH